MPRPATLTPELLNTFVTLVRLGGDASAAGKELDINQPSMSKRLAYFQHAGKLIRLPWLERRGKTWHLTDEGARVLPIVQDLLRRYDLMLDFLSHAGPSGLRFACGREAYSQYVGRALSRYLEAGGDQEPYQVSVEMRGEQRITEVANGLLGMALVTHDPGQIAAIARRPLYVEVLDEDPLALACSPRARCAAEVERLRDGKVPAKALAGLPLILPDPDSGLRRQFEERLRAAGLDGPLRVVVQGGGWGVILESVREGKGVGLLPRRKAEQEGGLVVRSPLPALVPPNVTYLIARRHPGTDEPDLSAADGRFLTLLREEVARGEGRTG